MSLQKLNTSDDVSVSSSSADTASITPQYRSSTGSLTPHSSRMSVLGSSYPGSPLISPIDGEHIIVKKPSVGYTLSPLLTMEKRGGGVSSSSPSSDGVLSSTGTAGSKRYFFPTSHRLEVEPMEMLEHMDD